MKAEPLCRVRGCPWPNDPDAHVPWCGHGTAGEHQHVPKRSQSKKAQIAAFLCHDCHKQIDEGPWGNAVLDIPTENGSKRVYRIWDVHDNTILEWEVPGLSAAVEASRGTHIGTPVEVSAVALSEEESDGDSNTDSVGRGADVVGAGGRARAEGVAGLSEAAEAAQGTEGRVDDFRLVPSLGAEFDPAMPLERWLQVAQTLKDMVLTEPWAIGDHWVFGEGRYGHEHAQGLDYGKSYATCVNYARVAKAIPLHARRGDLSFGHHSELYKLPSEQQERWLDWCLETEPPRKRSELREALGKSVSRVKRWSMAELREAVEPWSQAQQGPNRKFVHLGAKFFLDWLEAQDA